MQQFLVLDTAVDAVDPHSTLDRAAEMIRDQSRGYLVFCTVSSILAARREPSVKAAIDNATMVLPDGMPLVWLGKRDCGPRVERVYGPSFLRYVLTQTGSTYSHFFYGGTREILARMLETIDATWPEVTIAGSRAPSFGLDPEATPAEDIEEINASSADFVWVGLGHPKQELWMHLNRAALRAPVLAGIGAAFDFIAGTKREAPLWMQRSGLQWLHRLASEPSRLGRRYLIGNSVFVIALARDRFRKSR